MLDWTCTCIGLGHDHDPWKCQRQAKIMGGICTDCAYWHVNHQLPEPEKKRVGVQRKAQPDA
jgi:hypothetical protein